MKTKWKNCILIKSSTIKDAINNLDNTGLRIVLVVDDRQNFIGTINDGDIRRSIKKKISQTEKITKIVNKNPIIVNSLASKIEAFNKMLKNDISQIPVILDKKIIGLFTLEDILSKRKLDSIFFLMSGGKGLRLGEITKKKPKPMIQIGNIPIMERIILKAKSEGFQNFVSSVNYKKELIVNHFKNGERLGIDMKYIKEKQNKPLGTAGSLSYLKNINSPVVVTNSDVLIDVNYSELIDYHKKNKSDITVVTKINQTKSKFGVVKVKNQRIFSLIEKPILKTIILTGLYVLEPSIIKNIKKNSRLDMTDLIDLNIKKKRIISYPIVDDWIDIGDKINLVYAKKKFK